MHIQKKFPNMRLCKLWFEIGNRVTENSTGLFGLVKDKNNFILRVTPYRSLINLWENQKASAYEVSVKKVELL
jgi:hypothetical protein